MSLFADSQELKPKRKRIDSAEVHKDYTKTIRDKGGDKIAQRDAAASLTREITGHEVKDLYEQTGGKRGDRSTLPKEAQKALMMGDAVANYDLQDTEVQGDQSQRNAQIVNAAEESGKKVRRWLPW